ncbi:MAG: hypothetical protein ACRCWR_11940 [Saezia sp.]
MSKTNIAKLEIRVNVGHEDRIGYDFFVNGQYLPYILGIGEREENWCYSGFDLDFIEVDKIRFPHYNRIQVIQNAVGAFCGTQSPSNQFGTDRVVLYRCHCGCDYCGVISFMLHRNDTLVYWRDIRYEDDKDDCNTSVEDSGVQPIAELVFNRQEYEKIFEDYLDELIRLKQN